MKSKNPEPEPVSSKSARKDPKPTAPTLPTPPVKAKAPPTPVPVPVPTAAYTRRTLPTPQPSRTPPLQRQPSSQRPSQQESRTVPVPTKRVAAPPQAQAQARVPVPDPTPVPTAPVVKRAAAPEKDPANVVIYFAARRNNDITAEIPGRDAKLKLNPPGWRVAFFIDDGDGRGFEAMKRATEIVKISVDDDTPSSRLAISAFGILNAAQIAHEQRMRAKRIIIRSEMDDTLNATLAGRHPSTNLMWVLKERHLKQWGGVTVEFEQIPRDKNKAVAVLAKHDMPNYWSQQALASKEVKESHVGIVSPNNATLGTDGLPVLFLPTMSVAAIRARLEAVRQQLKLGEMILASKESVIEATSSMGMS